MMNFLCNIWKVEHGSAAYIQTPNNRKLLLDAGTSDDFSPSEHLYYNWGIATIDKLVVSHPHNDHIQNLPTLRNLMTINSRVWNPNTPERLIYPSGKSSLKEPMISWLEMSDSYTGTVSSDEQISNSSFFGGVQFNTFYAHESYLSGKAKDNINNYSLVLTVNYRGLLIVFPGDLEPEGWDAVLDKTTLENHLDAPYKVLIAPHHGRRSGIRWADGSLYSRFIDLLRPNLTIISDKWGNETTDPEAYRPYCSGINVECSGTVEEKKVLTTKTNDCISIQIEGNRLRIKI